MKILFVCDLRSIHAQKWIRYFIEKKAEVWVYSTGPFADTFLGARVFSQGPAVPQADFSGRKLLSLLLRSRLSSLVAGMAEKIFLRRKISALVSSTYRIRNSVQSLLTSIKPDVIHCLRLPNEGFAGAMLSSTVPIVVSTWGNDLTYWAKMPAFRKLTEETLDRAGFLFTDCERDVRLAREFGYSAEKPYAVLPGAGGMMPEDLLTGATGLEKRTEYFRDNHGIAGRPILLSLRGFGSQDIDNIPLLKASSILQKMGVEFNLVIAGKKDGFRYFKLRRFVESNGLDGRVFLIDEMSHEKALDALKGADFSVSISRNDGTPNSMLEAMTFGAIPIMSDIESIREWIKDGVNGYLIDPLNPESIAGVIQKALSESEKYLSMRQECYRIVSARAAYQENMSRAAKALEGLVRN